MRRILASFVAGGLLVAAAFAAVTVAGGHAVAEEPEAVAAETADETAVPVRRHRILDEVLDELVADGTIDQDQADAITDALVARTEELAEEYPILRRPFRAGLRVGALLDDGVITADELAELPEGHPLRDPDGVAAEYLEDGRITVDEVRELAHRRHAARHGD